MTRKAGRVRKLPEKEPDKRRKGERRRRKGMQEGEQRKSLVREEAVDKRKRLQSRQLGRGSELGVWETSSLLRYVALGKALSLSYPWLSFL